MQRGAPIPLYFQIFQILRARIGSGAYAVGSQLPTDEALMQEFKVSRHTIRSAIQDLVTMGLVERFAGRGSFILGSQPPPSQWSIGSVEDFIDTSFAHTYTILDAGEVPGAANPTAAQVLGLSVDDRMFQVRAVRASVEGPYAYSYVYFPTDIGGKLPHELFDRRPLILLVEEYCGLAAFTVKQVASAEAADEEVGSHLDVRPGSAVLVLERTYFTRDRRPLEHTRIRYRPDRYQQTVTFLRRTEPPYRPPDVLEAKRFGGPDERTH